MGPDELPRTMVFMTPSPGINYNFVAGAYLVCSFIFMVLLALDKVRVRSQERQEREKESAATIQEAVTAGQQEG